MNTQVDKYIAKAPPFAQPILTYLRELIHKACPGAKETIKWSRPFFEHQGTILCNMAAFKEHCSFSFWGEGDALRRITSLSDLPPDRKLLASIRQAAASIENGQHTSPMTARRSVVKPPLTPPAEFTAALQKHQRANAAFAALTRISHRAAAKRKNTAPESFFEDSWSAVRFTGGKNGQAACWNESNPEEKAFLFIFRVSPCASS